MKIKFNMPVKLPENVGISYAVKTMWRYDGKKIGERLTLELDFDLAKIPVEDAIAIFHAIKEANPSIFEATLKFPVDPHACFEMSLVKHGDSSEQDEEDCEIIHWLPDDPIEWEE